MLMTRCVAFAVATLVFGSASTVIMAGDASRSCRPASVDRIGSETPNIVTAARNDHAALAIGRPAWQAPAGHRQPRAGDVPVDAELSAFASEQRRLDAELDRRLVICRGC